MNPPLQLSREMCRQEMSVAVPPEQQHLKCQQTGVPNRWASAESRQNVFARDQLHLEQQECTEKDCDGVTETGRRSSQIVRRAQFTGGGNRLRSAHGYARSERSNNHHRDVT